MCSSFIVIAFTTWVLSCVACRGICCSSSTCWRWIIRNTNNRSGSWLTCTTRATTYFMRPCRTASVFICRYLYWGCSGSGTACTSIWSCSCTRIGCSRTTTCWFRSWITWYHLDKTATRTSRTSRQYWWNATRNTEIICFFPLAGFWSWNANYNILSRLNKTPLNISCEFVTDTIKHYVHRSNNLPKPGTLLTYLSSYRWMFQISLPPLSLSFRKTSNMKLYVNSDWTDRWKNLLWCKKVYRITYRNMQFCYWTIWVENAITTIIIWHLYEILQSWVKAAKAVIRGIKEKPRQIISILRIIPLLSGIV